MANLDVPCRHNNFVTRRAEGETRLCGTNDNLPAAVQIDLFNDNSARRLGFEDEVNLTGITANCDAWTTSLNIKRGGVAEPLVVLNFRNHLPGLIVELGADARRPAGNLRGTYGDQIHIIDHEHTLHTDDLGATNRHIAVLATTDFETE